MSISIQAASNEAIYDAQKIQSVSDDLKIEKTEQVDSVKESAVSQSYSEARFDEYIKGSSREEAPGLYEIKPSEEKGYEISYKPYKEAEPAEDRQRAESDKEKAPDAEEKQKEEKTTVNTDQVDAEIKALKREKLAIRQQLDQAEISGNNEQEIKLLKQRLTSVEKELDYKSTDTYRKQHAVYL